MVRYIRTSTDIMDEFLGDVYDAMHKGKMNSVKSTKRFSSDAEACTNACNEVAELLTQYGVQITESQAQATRDFYSADDIDITLQMTFNVTGNVALAETDIESILEDKFDFNTVKCRISDKRNSATISLTVSSNVRA